ncbi:SDR family NAD(P)-dependent oxidoreductase [Vibrio parahaemolyticus]|uniref:SDR family NAD(P)-dependent oxidoreductase n=1 Tax=Vibrio parahaemolyticus TaxID=670 RepID=UPI0006A5F2B3|nr:SDR family oxidoreductase [Vibrio parahaemolyticus]EGQ8297844.1 SDR family oxidoreductase [Vibrio parahaemolyticus]EGQ8944636.1 SDR family oxidoreductase [Vibrio parahaemolyticus]EGR1596135.1 SDR family oxidoreductase [Vibrio parahaemolyticus]EGR1759835.1 SDR family oxidoreductase [Vibrio parahaemolyticus]EGR3005617.1 SDR family NAD(P)-dependent oxidoreductase [Vibrio parahaemolyticus]
MELINKTAIVTGAAGGIGQSIIAKLREQGAKVLAVDISEQSLQMYTSFDSKQLGTFVADVTDYQQVEAMVTCAVEQFGSLDIMVNNAGIGAPKPLLDHDPIADFEPISKVNQNGVYYGILAAGRQFQAQGTPGVILNTSSVYARMASEMTFTYNVSKAAVDMMTKCAALELAPLGIRVCAVAPGRVDTPMLRQYEEIGLWNHIRKEQMRQNFTQPEEIADVVAFLVSEKANCINGCTISASDGFENFKYPLMG